MQCLLIAYITVKLLFLKVKKQLKIADFMRFNQICVCVRICTFDRRGRNLLGLAWESDHPSLYPGFTGHGRVLGHIVEPDSAPFPPSVK